MLIICLSLSAVGAADADSILSADSDLMLNSNSNLIYAELSESSNDLSDLDNSINSNSLSNPDSSTNLDSEDNDLDDESGSLGESEINDDGNQKILGESGSSEGALTDSNSGDIYISASGDDGSGDGSEGNPYKTIYKALSSLPSSSTVNIHLASGSYVLQENISFSSGKSINFIGQEYNKTFFDAQEGHPCFLINSGNLVSFRNISFVNYYIPINNSDINPFHNIGTLLFDNCIFENNDYHNRHSSYYGVGTAIIWNDGTLTLNGTKVIGNGNNSGAFIYSNNQEAVLNINNSEFDNYLFNQQDYFININSGNEINIANSKFSNFSSSTLSSSIRLIYSYGRARIDFNICNNTFENICLNGSYDTYLFYFGYRANGNADGSNNICGNTFINISECNGIIYIPGRSGNNNISNNKFKKISDREIGPARIGNVVYINGNKNYLQNNSMEDLEFFRHIFINSVGSDSINLNVTCLNQTINHSGAYALVRVTDDMGNDVTLSQQYLNITLYFDGVEVGACNVTNGTGIIAFSAPLENKEYDLFANASFLSSESRIQGTRILVNITSHVLDIYVSDSVGSDETGDGSEENPYKSLKKAFENVYAEDIVTIHLASGNYTGEENSNISARLDSDVWGGNVSIIGEYLDNTIIDVNQTFIYTAKYSKLYLNNIILVNGISRKQFNIISDGILVFDNCKFQNSTINANNLTIMNSIGYIAYAGSGDAFYIYNSTLYRDEVTDGSWISSTNLLVVNNSSISNVFTNMWRYSILLSSNVYFLNSAFSNCYSNANSINGTNVTVANSTFFDCKVKGYQMVFATESLDFINNTMTYCGSQNGGDGLISTYGKAKNFRVMDSRFIECDNIPMVYTNYASEINATIDNCSFENCANSFSPGGALNIKGNATVSNCKFTNCNSLGGIINVQQIYGQRVDLINNVFNNSYSARSIGGNYCVNQWAGTAFLRNNTVIADDVDVSILSIVEYPENSHLVQTNAYVSFVNKTINSENTYLYISVTDDMGNPITYGSERDRNVSFILSGELLSYSPVYNGIAKLALPKVLANGEYSFRGSIPFLSEDAVINYTTITVDLDFNLTKVYVAANGSDEEGDGSEENPFKTIAKAIEYGYEKTLNVEIYVKEGVYSGLGNVNLTIDNLGYLSIFGTDGFNKTIIDAEGIHKFLDESERSNLNLYNLTFTNAMVNKTSNLGAVSSLGTISIKDCVFEGLSGNESAVMIYSSGIMNLLNSMFINEEGSTRSAICIDGGESYISNNVMKNYDNAVAIAVKSGLINAIITVMDNSTFNIGGSKLDLKATVTDDMGNSISGGNIRFKLINESTTVDCGEASVNNGIALLNTNHNLNKNGYLLRGIYSFASGSAIVKTAYATVNKNYDLYDVYVSTDGKDGEGDGTIENPFKTITRAMEYGFSKTYNLRVLIREGTYTGSGITNLTIDVDGNLTLAGADGYNKTVIDANKSRFFTVNGNKKLNLVNLTFVNSEFKVRSNSSAPIYNLGNLKISECIFENHTRDWYGLICNSGTLLINNTIFNNLSSNRTETDKYGGAIYSDNESVLEIHNSKFYNSKTGYGGAIYAVSAESVNIVGCEFINCSAVHNGGALNVNALDIYIGNCEFINCSANEKSLSKGGAIYIGGKDNGDVTIENNYFNNCSSIAGEAIYVSDHVYLENNTMIGCNKTTAPIYAKYTNAYFYYDDVYTNLRTNFNITIRLCDDKGNRISTASSNTFSLYIGDETIYTANTITTGIQVIGMNTIYENGVYPITGDITGIGGDYYDVEVRYGTLTVNRTIDSPLTVYVDKNNGDDSGIGSIQLPFKTLSKAAEYALSESNYPTIILVSSTFSGEGYVNQTFENVKSLSIIGWSASIDGEGSNWIFKFNNITNVSIENLFLMNAKSDSLGSVIFANNTENVNIYCDFLNNSAKEGGCIYIEGNVFVNNSYFEDCSAESGAAIVSKGELTVNNTIFDNCTATDSSIVIYGESFAGDNVFWGANYFTPEEFANANVLLKETDATRAGIAPDNWIILNSNIRNATYENLTRAYLVFFSHYNDTEVVDTLRDFSIAIDSTLGNSMDDRLRLPEGRGIEDLIYFTNSPGMDKLTISTVKGVVLLEYDINIREFKKLDVVYVSNDGDDDGDGTYDSPFKTLQNGLKFINDNGTLYLKGYYENIVFNESLTHLTISSYDGEAIIDGLGTNPIFDTAISLVNIRLSLYGLKLMNGISYYGILGTPLLYLDNLINCTLINNSGMYQSSGGYEYFLRVSSCPVINCSFLNNTGQLTIGANVPFINNSFIGNNDTHIQHGSGTDFEDCIFINNTARGDSLIFSGYQGKPASATNCYFEGNDGGVFSGDCLLSLNNCTFISNSGCVLCVDRLDVDNCTFINNSAYRGGVIAGGGSVYVANSIFINNSATYGGVYCGSYAYAIIENSIFEGNTAQEGAVLYSEYDFELNNNYWGKNYESAEEFINDGLIIRYVYNDGWSHYYTAPENWVILNISCGDTIDWNSSNVIEVSLNTLNDGTELEYDCLPEYTVFIMDSLGNVIPCEVLISEGIGTFTYDAANRVEDTISIYSTLTNNLLYSKDLRVVIPTSTVLTVPETSVYGNDIPVSIKVEAADGSIVEGNISLLVNGEKLIDLVLENGIASYNLAVETTGTYEITAVLNSDSYATSSDSSSVTVTKKLTALSIGNYYAMIGENVVMEIKFSDIEGNPLNGNISIVLPDGTEVNMTIDGMTSYDFGIFNEDGNRTVFVEYAGDENYESASATAFIVVYGPGNVTVKHTDAGDAADIQAAIDSANPGDIIRLGDYDYVNVSDVIISKNLTISGDGASITSTGDGTPIFNVPAVSEGGPESINITGVDFKLSNGDIVVKASADNDTDDPLSIVTPDIRINGNAFELINETTVAESITVLELDSERGILAPTGEISISGNSIAAGVNPFDFEVTSIGTGDNINISPQNLTVEKKATVIHYEDMNTTTVDQSVDGRSGKYFNFQLTDTEGNPIVGVPMQIGFLGVIYDESNGIITNETGGARLQINLGYKNDYTFAICFLGNDEYNGSFVIAKIIVTPQKGSLTVPNKSYSASAKTKTLTATFKSVSGKPVSGKKITFTVNGKTYYAKTNDKGVASVNVSLSKKGTYSFTAKFTTNGMYETMTKTAKLTIK